MKFIPKENTDTAPEITPLLDVVFILLIFFILAAAFSVHGLDMAVPEAKSSHPVAGKVVEISLKKDGRIYAEKELIVRKELKYFFQKTRKIFFKTPGKIMLKVEPQANVGDLIFILDTARSQGCEDLVLATIPPQKEHND